MPDRRNRKQHIHVITSDGTYQYLIPAALDALLEKNCIMKFKRSNGWVTVGIDPIRVKDRREASRSFNGPDKRSII
jgi:hypothetical protein